MRRPATVLAAVAALFAVLTGCGGDSADSGSEKTLDASSALVDRSRTPYVNALEIDGDGDFLLTTNKGFWKVARDGSDVEQIRDAKVVTPQGTAPVGTFLEIADVGTGELLGSGHPDSGDQLPEFLGFMRSRDGGRTWHVSSRLGTADIHVIRRVGRTLLLWDAVLGAVLVTRDGGRTFKENFTPRSLILDMVVDPRDEDYLLISTEDQLFHSRDQGARWRPLPPAVGARFAWAPDGTLMRGLRDGTWERSADRGETWEAVGKLPGEPWKVKAVSATEVYVALADGSIAATKDGGRTWDVLFEAPTEAS